MPGIHLLESQVKSLTCIFQLFFIIKSTLGSMFCTYLLDNGYWIYDTLKIIHYTLIVRHTAHSTDWQIGVCQVRGLSNAWNNSLKIGIYPAASALRYVCISPPYKKHIYTPVPGVSSPAAQLWYCISWSTHCCGHWLGPFAWCQSIFDE